MVTNDDNKYVPMGTKINPAMAVVWDSICEALGTDTYHMLQTFINAMIRAASGQHELTPEVKKLMTMLDADVGWQQAINLCAPNGKLTISQMILIVEQEEHKGFSAVMIDKPFMDNARQTECIDDIFERVTEVCMKGIYKKLRRLAVDMDCKSQADLLLTMIDAQTITNMDESDRQEMKGDAMFNDYGRRIEYGKRAKSYKHMTPDSHQQQKILFIHDADRDIADREAIGLVGPDTIEKAIGTKPFTEEP